MQLFTGTLQERHQKAKVSLTRLETEAGDLRERVRGLDQRCINLEDAKTRMETDLQVARRQAAERHTELEVRFGKSRKAFCLKYMYQYALNLLVLNIVFINL